jgi:hypothetical protein
MSEQTLAQVQADMRSGYMDGAPGVLVSGVVWLVAAVVASVSSPRTAVWVLVAGGTLIHPLSVLVTRALGRRGSHSPGNPLAHLALEGTVWFIGGIAIALLMQLQRVEWFFPAMLVLIGGRYLTFQTLYGLRSYWICGAVLCLAGVGLVFAHAPAAMAAGSGSLVELVFAGVLFSQSRRNAAA